MSHESSFKFEGSSSKTVSLWKSLGTDVDAAELYCSCGIKCSSIPHQHVPVPFPGQTDSLV